jgi:hypothetical protein
MNKDQNRYKNVSRMLDKAPGKGHNVTWLIIHGSDIYRELFVYFLERLDRSTEEVIVIPFNVIQKRLNAPASVITYPLYKFKQSKLITIHNSMRTKVIRLTKENDDLWNELIDDVEGNIK